MKGRLPAVSLLHGNALDTKLEGNSFDFCFCLNLIINLTTFSDVENLFKEVRRILKPGGTFAFDIRNSFSPIIQMQYRFAKYYDTGLTVPLRSYRAGRFLRLLAENSFTPEYKKFLGFPGNCFAPAVLFAAKKT